MRLRTAYLLLASLVPASWAILEDEAYQIDYHHALLGTPQAPTTFFHKPSSSSSASLLLTLSEKLILGAVNPKDGLIVWRQNISDYSTETRSPGLLRAVNGEDTVVSALGSDVLAWGASDGKLAWRNRFEGSSVVDLELVETQRTGGTQAPRDAIVLSRGKNAIVRRLGGASGSVKWGYSDDSGDIPFHVSTSATALYYISLHSAARKGYKIKVTELDVQNGRLVNQYMLNSEHEVTSPESIIFVGSNTASALIVWPDQELKALRVNLIGSKSIHSVDIENGTEEPIRDIKVHASSTIPHFLVHYNTLTKSWADVFHLDIKQATISRAYQLPSVESTAAFALDTVENKLYFACITDSTVDLYSSESKKTLESRKIAQSPGAPRHATLQVVPRDSGFATRFAQVDESGDWVLIRNGEVGWHRPESLTDAVVAAWAEVNGVEALAHELELEGHQDVFSAYIHRLKRHAKGLQEHLLPWLQNLPTRVMSNFLSSEGAELRQFGFDKLVIVATRKGRALAIDFGREGAILWNVKIADSDGAWEPKAIYAQHEVATIFAADGSSVKLNVETGEVFEPLPPTGEYSSILLLQDTPAPVPVGIKADGTPSGLIPSLDGNQIIVTLSEDGILRGWNGVELTTPAWVFVPPRDQKIIQAITRPSHDPVASIGKVLGDRSVLYKYLNPNLALITAVADSTVTFYLLDGVSGQVLYTASQTGVETTQPISSVISENWFAYSFGAEISDSKGYQLVISELYESPIANDRGLLGDAANYSSIRTSTGFPRPHVISQAYMIPEPISNMAVTETRQGITVRQLLCTLPASNAIVGIPRFFLDPRRPVNRDPTSQEAEEGLMRYVSFLDFDPKWYLTHAREVMGIQKIESSPTLLESSTLVFAYGFDVFGTRLAPSQPFDLLGKGFSKMQLLLTVVALAAGVALLAPMARRKQVDLSWKS